MEIVIKGPPKVGKIAGEVNFAEGGKTSAGETTADTGSITFTKADPMGIVEGTVSATYADGSEIMGTFHAEFCAGGQGY